MVHELLLQNCFKLQIEGVLVSEMNENLIQIYIEGAIGGERHEIGVCERLGFFISTFYVK